jgi:NADH-quinone oxidoreductase subunit G
MNALGLKKRYTIDYTSELPVKKGFSAIEFDALPDYFDITGAEHRGYLIDSHECEAGSMPEPVSELPTYDGAVLYQCNEGTQFSAFTAKCRQVASEAKLRGSAQFAAAAKLNEGDTVQFTLHGESYRRVFTIDTAMKGTVAINPYFDRGLSSSSLSYYRFSQPKLERVDS